MDVPLDEFQVRQFQTSGGGKIFQIPMLEFPGLSGYAYLVLIEDVSGPYRVLIDSGSGFGVSNQQLEAGLQVVSGLTGEPFGFPDLNSYPDHAWSYRSFRWFDLCAPTHPGADWCA